MKLWDMTRQGMLVAAMVGSSLLLASCASQGSYVWSQELPPSDAANDYVIASGDLLGIRVFNQDNLSTHARVRSDGRIAVPFLGDVEVRGKAPSAVSKDLQQGFKEYVVSPVVTVTVEESLPTSISVLGEVNHPGIYTVDGSSGVLQALAASGGFTEFASKSSIFVVRRATGQRIRFQYASLAQGDGAPGAFRVRTGDVVIVE